MYTLMLYIVCIATIASLHAVTVLDGPVGARELEESTSMKGIIINISITKSPYVDKQYGPC